MNKQDHKLSNSPKKLTLAKETLKTLDHVSLGRVVGGEREGGGGGISNDPVCWYTTYRQ